MHLINKNVNSFKELSQVVDTPNFCYLVGLICTDGHIQWPNCTRSSHMYRCIISQHKKERELLENIQQIFGGKIYKLSKFQLGWSIGGKDFIVYLRDEVGLSNNKSLTLNVLTWFSKLSEGNKFHFLRGVIDGDGSISCIPQTRRLPTGTTQLLLTKYFCIVSCSSAFITMLFNYLCEWKPTLRKQIFSKEKYPNIFLRKDGKVTTLYKVSVYGEKAIKCLERVMYNAESFLHMKRKLLLARRMQKFSQCKNKKKFVQEILQETRVDIST